MKSQEELISVLNSISQKDVRYKIDAYTFVLAGLNFTMEKLNRQGHLNGKELCQGLREYALEQYGRMAKTVFEHWGILKTDDFGFIVFNMVEAGVLGKTNSDKITDFKDQFSFQKVFEDDFKC